MEDEKTRGWRSEVRGQQLQIKSAKNLKVYQKAYALAMEIFQLSKSWPSEEKYSLTDQIRRASRSVCTNLEKLGRKGDMKPISSVSLLIQTARIAKPILGSILHWIADTLARQIIYVFQPNADRLDLC